MGSENSLSGERARGIEQCICPPAYAGLSCEQCAFGHVRIDDPSRRGMFQCLPCQCNGHSPTCDPQDLKSCHQCLHNTVGAQCDQCAPGYYGTDSQSIVFTSEAEDDQGSLVLQEMLALRSRMPAKSVAARWK